MLNTDFKIIVDNLKLLPHPEGGFYREVYRSSESLLHESLPERYTGSRNFVTSIYFLLEGENFSAFHKIKSEELWFFHSGNPVNIFLIQNDELQTIKLGPDIANGQCLQAAIPSQTWFAAEVVGQTGFSLVSCVVAPGFDFADFELASKEKLNKEFPHLSNIINKFTRA